MKKTKYDNTKSARIALILLPVFLTGPLIMGLSGEVHFGLNWRTANRSSTGIAPDPVTDSEAVVQVYSARAFNWRGMFSNHTWIATKPENEKEYTVHQVVGWRSWRGLPVVVSEPDIPDRSWFGNKPEIILDLRGPEASQAIEGILQAVKNYPYKDKYVMWPGPNSNTFTAFIGRHVPQMKLELPPTAIGKDFLANGEIFANAPSGTGYQFSLFGLLGILIGRIEGIELNLFGLIFGIDPYGPAFKLPGIGRIGFDLD